MKRWALWVLLLLSLGVNVGILATLLVQHWREPAPVDPGLHDWPDGDDGTEPALETPAAPDRPPQAPSEPAPPAPTPATVPSAPRRAETEKPRSSEPRAASPRPETLEPVPAAPASPEPIVPEPATPEPAPTPMAPPDLSSPRADRVFQNLADRLGLAGEPRDRFLVVQHRAFESMRGERQRLVGARAALRRELAAPAPDQARVDAFLKEATAAQSAMEQTLVSSLLESRALLNPEQQRMYMRFVEERLRPAASPQRRALRDRYPQRRGVRR